MRITTVLTVAAIAVAASLIGAAAPARASDVESGDYCRLDLDSDTLTCADTADGLNTAAREESVSPLATYVLGRLYDNTGLTGPYLEITASTPCDTNADIDYGVSNVAATWNDRISSFQGYNNCEIRIYEDASYGGASYGAYASSSNVGAAMNDKTTSVRFY